MPAQYLETRAIPLRDLTPYPGNARRGDVEQIRGSIRRNGQYRSLIIRDTGTLLIVLAGNHTREALAAEGYKEARCEVIQCTDEEARRINLADNKLAELGSYDSDALVELLSYLDGDYEGTGWADADVSAMLDVPSPAGTGDLDTGELLALAGVTVGEPRHQVKPGQVWALGHHRLAIADLFTDWPLWAPLLRGDATFMPYPTPLVPHSPEVGPLVMVQPVAYLAGHLLDKWEDITGAAPALTDEENAG